MAAQRLRDQLIASNVANSETTRTKEGGPSSRATSRATQTPTQTGW